MLILVNVSSLIILYNVCFDDFNEFYKSKFHFAVEILFAIFIILQFFHKYLDTETLFIISNPKQIAMKYIKSWFIIDIISIIPFELFLDLSQNNNTYIKFIKMIRLLRLPKLLQTLDMHRFDNLAVSINSLVNRSNKGSNSLLILFNIRYIFKIVRLIFMVLMLIYILGCIWYVYCKKMEGYA